MFVTKTERSKACATSAVRPSATKMERSGEDERDHAGDDRAEDEEQDDQGRGRAEEELAVLQVLLGELREVLVDREVAGDRRLDAGLLVEPLDGGDDVRDPVLVDAEADEQRSRAAVLRDEPLVVVRRDDGGGAGLPQLLGEGVHAGTCPPPPSRS